MKCHSSLDLDLQVQQLAVKLVKTTVLMQNSAAHPSGVMMNRSKQIN